MDECTECMKLPITWSIDQLMQVTVSSSTPALAPILFYDQAIPPDIQSLVISYFNYKTLHVSYASNALHASNTKNSSFASHAKVTLHMTE